MFRIITSVSFHTGYMIMERQINSKFFANIDDFCEYCIKVKDKG